MKLKLVGGDSDGVVTAYYVSTFDNFAHILTDDISIVCVSLLVWKLKLKSAADVFREWGRARER